MLGYFYSIILFYYVFFAWLFFFNVSAPSSVPPTEKKGKREKNQEKKKNFYGYLLGHFSLSHPASCFLRPAAAVRLFSVGYRIGNEEGCTGMLAATYDT